MKDEEFQKLLDAPAPVILKLSKPRLLLHIFIESVVCISVFGVLYFRTNSWPVVLFLGTFFIAFFIRTAGMIWCFFKSAHLKTILHDEYFISERWWNKDRRYAWRDVTEFKVGFWGGVIYDHLPELESEYPDDAEYGIYYIANLSAKQTALLLNHWRERALAANK